MTEKNFKAAIAALASTFGRVVEPAMLKGYEIGLADLTDDQLAGAMAIALREARFMPSPAELRDFVGAGTKAGGLVAWDAVRGAMRRYGYTSSVDFGPLTNAVVRNLGGWRRLDDTPTAELETWTRKEFLRVYELLAHQRADALNGAPLAGAFGGEPVRIAIAGHVAPRALGAAPPVSPIVRALADGASGDRR